MYYYFLMNYSDLIGVNYRTMERYIGIPNVILKGKVIASAIGRKIPDLLLNCNFHRRGYCNV
jgi:hypothetical protein